jgi:hypothetical protein
VQQAALKRPPARNVELPASQAARGGAAGALAQTLNGSPRVVAQRALAVQLNRGGLPENLRNGVERLSGVSMAGVKVHYNSSKPSQLNAEAYAQGRDIHLAPGKEHHLPHEAWHVAQQVKGRVKPTMQFRKTVPINDDKRLEREADAMGKKAATLGTVAQRAVPTNYKAAKPTPNTGGYTPKKETYKTIPFEEKHYKSTYFGDNVRENVFKENYPTLIDNRIRSVRVATGTQESIKGTHIDHILSWRNIANVMIEKNDFNLFDGSNEPLIPDTVDRDLWYSRWDGFMYYNDLDNLRPMLGSDNSSKGKNTGKKYTDARIAAKTARAIAETHGEWIKYQFSVNEQLGQPEAASGALVDAITAETTGLGNSIEQARLTISHKHYGHKVESITDILDDDEFHGINPGGLGPKKFKVDKPALVPEKK